MQKPSLLLRILWIVAMAGAAMPVAQASLHTVTGAGQDLAPAAVEASPEMDAAALAAVTRAAGLLARGDRLRALETLTAAQNAINQARPPALRAQGLLLLGRAYLQTGQFDLAEPLIRRAISVAAAAGLAALQASAYNDLGLLQAARNDDGSALRSYRQGGELLLAQPDPGLSARLLLNMADAAKRRGDATEAARLATDAIAPAQRVASPSERALLLAAIAARQLDASARDEGGANPPASIAHLLDQARADARQAADLRAESQAQGLSGRYWELKGSDAAALRWTRRAIFSAQAAAAPDLLYRWQWQAARLAAHRGDADDALALYRTALETLRPIQHDVLMDLRATRASYRDSIGPLFTEFADLLLRRSISLDPAGRQALLQETRSVIEQLKTVELEDYFRDDCVAEFQGRQARREGISDDTAVLYPIVFPDRLELLLSVGAELHRVSVSVSSEQLRAEATRFRRLLENGTGEDFLPHAQRLHSWLIGPLEEQLAQSSIATLAIVPEGPLLGIPFAALHDGNEFLVQQLAVATVPGLHLVEPRASRPSRMLSLVAGLTDPVQGFPALPHVGREIANLSALYEGDAQVLSNQQFTVAAVEQSAGSAPYSLVHIASHGQFDSDPRKTFLLTYDGRLGISALERLVKAGRAPDDPVDLLTLSACQTAVGDERAALGLAGVAIKAGARSVVATLWHINDEASSELIREFYRGLLVEKLPKSAALRGAQLRLLDDPRFQHPRFWAPYMLIGNWN